MHNVWAMQQSRGSVAVVKPVQQFQGVDIISWKITFVYTFRVVWDTYPTASKKIVADVIIKIDGQIIVN